MPKLTVADLEVLFTANTLQVSKAEKQVLAIGKKIESNPIEIDADAKGALGGMDRVEDAAKKLVSERAVVKLDADISRAEKNLERAVDKLEDLHIRAEGGLDVTADVKRAEASIQRIERQLTGLRSARNVVDVEVDPDPAESKLKGFLSLFRKKTEEAGAEGGKSLTSNLDAATRGAGQKVGEVVGGDVESTLVDALAAIPIAGGIILAGVAIGKAVTGAIQDGLNQEKGRDRLQALTGVSEADALRISRAAGEAYANNFGESVESNMDATRLALQFGILDPKATTRDAQIVVQGLTGIADVLGEDVRPIAQTVAQLLSNGLAPNAQAAYDLIAAGARNGMNRNEDLLDTLTEYPSLFKRLGLSGEEALGLVNQGMKAGARNSDLAADALKEFQIRATDASEQSAAGFRAIGLNAEDMTAKIAAGGAGAREGLAEVLTALREMEPGVERNNAAIALFGTQAEDLGDALFAMDLSTAVEQLDGVTGSAQRMFDTLADNDASKISQAQRNLEVAADGIKGALAAAFSEPLGDLADWVSENRGPLTQFLLDLANGALDFGVAMVEGAANATEAIGTFIAGPMADMVGWLGSISNSQELKDLADDMREFDDTTSDAAATMRDDWIGSIEEARSKLNEFGDPIVALGFVNDAALRTADAVSQVGLAADGTRIAIEGLDTANLSSSESGQALQEQLDASASALDAEYQAALLAGESQENLQARYESTSGALMAQLTAMGLTEQQAQSLIDTVLKTPGEAYTVYTSNASAESDRVDKLNQKIVQLPDGSFIIVSDTSPAQRAIDDFLAKNATKQVNIATSWSGGLARASGGPIFGPGGPRDDLVPVMASNGEHMLTASEVSAAGGHGAIYRLRKALLNGTLQLASGGPVSVPDSTWRTQVPGFGSAMPTIDVALPSRAAPSMPSLVGLRIEGRMEIGADGVARLVEGRVVDMIRSSLGAAKGRR